MLKKQIHRRFFQRISLELILIHNPIFFTFKIKRFTFSYKRLIIESDLCGINSNQDQKSNKYFFCSKSTNLLPIEWFIHWDPGT